MSASETLVREKPKGLTRILRAAVASYKGLQGAYRGEAAFRQELGLSVLVIPLGLWLGSTGEEQAFMDAPIHRISHEHNLLSGLAKDIGSAAVLMSFVLLGVMWLLVLIAH